MVNYIFNEDTLVLSIFSPTGEYSMITSDNPVFFQIVNKIRKPETEWKDIEPLITSKIFNYSLGYISMFEKNGDLYYQICGDEPKLIKGRLYSLITYRAQYSCYKLYFDRVLNFISEYENLIPLVESKYFYGLSNNGIPIVIKGKEAVEVDYFPPEDEIKEVSKEVLFADVYNLNSSKIMLSDIVVFLSSFWKRDTYKDLKKQSLNPMIQKAFLEKLRYKFSIFDDSILEYTLDFMNDAQELYSFLVENIPFI
jgi:hypothetical protein